MIMIDVTFLSQIFEVFLEWGMVRDHHLVVIHVTVLYLFRSE